MIIIIISWQLSDMTQWCIEKKIIKIKMKGETRRGMLGPPFYHGRRCETCTGVV